MKRIKSYILILIAFGMVFSLSINYTSAKTHARPIIKIGALGPLAILPGTDMKKGVELAIEEINDGAGVDVDGTAHDFEAYIEDNSGSDGLPDSTKALSGLSKLTTDVGVSAIIGGFRTEVMWAIQANLGTTGTPFLGVGSTAQLISPYYWRVGPSNGSLLAYSLIELYGFGLTALGVRNVTIVREDLAWTGPLSNLIHYYLTTALPALAGSIPITFTEDIKIAEGATVDAVSSKLVTVDPDVDALLPLFSAPAQVTNAWFQNDMPQFLAGINVDAQKSTFFDETEGAAYGEITIHPMPPDIDRTTKTAAFKTAFEDEHGESPSYTAAYAYDAVYIVKEAIEAGDSSTLADIQTNLLSTDYVGAVATYKFTNELGPQLVLNATLGYDKVPYPGVADYGTINVHDLYTGSKVGFRDPQHVQTYFVQWQQNGTQKTIWGKPMFPQNETFADVEWPIVHSEHGYTAPGVSTGFELPLSLVVFANLALIVRLRRKR